MERRELSRLADMIARRMEKARSREVDDTVTFGEAMRILGCSERHLRHLVAKGFPCNKSVRPMRFSRTTLYQYNNGTFLL